MSFHFQVVDQLKKLDTDQEKKYQEHVAKEKSDMVRKFSKFTEEERARMLKSLKEQAEKHKSHPRIYQPVSLVLHYYNLLFTFK